MPSWDEVIKEIGNTQQAGQNLASTALDIVRRKYLNNLHQKTGRNTIAYYSGFLTKPGYLQGAIIDDDKNGFMMAVHKLEDKNKGLDLILHTPGGDIAATESIVDYLHRIFGKNIRVIVPQIAMSAGTMIACSSFQILMGKHSNLGPIDPQLKGLPAHGVIEEFKRAAAEIKKDPRSKLYWEPILNKYDPTFLSRCENAIKWSDQFARQELEKVMFAKDRNKKAKAASVVKKLTDYKGNKAHNRHIHIDDCMNMGLNILPLESDPELQDLVLTVHHCYMHALANTTSIKIIENHLGIAKVHHAQPNG